MRISLAEKQSRGHCSSTVSTEVLHSQYLSKAETLPSFKLSKAHVRELGSSFATLDLEADRHKYIPRSYLHADSDLDGKTVEHKGGGELY